jgi:hypothetical protein
VPESPDHTLAFNLPARVFLGRKGKCEPAHTSIEKISLRSESEAATGGDLASNRGRGTMPARNRILICAALTTGFLLQGSSCFGDDRTKVSGTWKLVTFMTENVDNKARENVCDKQAEGYLTFTDAGRVFGFATTKGGEPLASTPESYAPPPIISYSGKYRLDEKDLAVTIDSVWEQAWPHTDELHHYRLDGDKRLIETTHLRYPNAFGNKMISILIWERE